MDQDITFIFMGLVVAITLLALFKVRKPREMGRLWHIPWNGVLFLCFLALLLLIRHQLSLSGIDLPER